MANVYAKECYEIARFEALRKCDELGQMRWSVFRDIAKSWNVPTSAVRKRSEKQGLIRRVSNERGLYELTRRGQVYGDVEQLPSEVMSIAA